MYFGPQWDGQRAGKSLLLVVMAVMVTKRSVPKIINRFINIYE